ncbi:MAG: hypothetical protein H6Q31_1315 [Bacteroidetes bacterium]|jgi:Mn-containing catalase|nr:hypothetical protein [Bacteroidota bacterium]
MALAKPSHEHATLDQETATQSSMGVNWRNHYVDAEGAA